MALLYFFASAADDWQLPSGPGPSDPRAGLTPMAPPDQESLGDAEQIERIRGGDEAAYSEVFAALYEQLREFCVTYVGSLAVAEDIVQDVFLDLWIRHAEWNPSRGIRAYLFRAVRNRAINAVRNERTAALLDPGDVDAWMGAAPFPPDADQTETMLADALAPVLMSLPPARRRAALLRWRFGLGYAEIAAVLDTSVASVTMHIRRAREAVRPVVERYLRS